MTTQQPVEEIRLDIDPVDAYLRQTPALIERHKAWTANLVAILLVGGVVVSLPLYLLSVWLSPGATDSIAPVFEKWYAVVSPLAGAAVGAYYTSRAEAATERRRR